MALEQSVLPELFDACRSGEGLDLIHKPVHLVWRELVEPGRMLGSRAGKAALRAAR
jgi:hypothetical protein